MISNRLALLSLIAFVTNAVAHIFVLTGMVPISLSHTWPLHLMSMVMFLTMLYCLFAGTYQLAQELEQKAQGERGELYSYAQQVESRQLRQSTWQRMFGGTPVWVGIAVPIMFLYAFGLLAAEGFQSPESLAMHEGKYWLNDDDSGLIRPASDDEIRRENNMEIRFATAAFALFGFVPWAYFTYRTVRPSLKEVISDD